MLNVEILKLRTHYQENRYLFIDGQTVRELLLKMGAVTTDLDLLRRMSEATLQKDPTLPFRKTRNGRYRVDFTKGTALRLEGQPFVLSEDEDFVRHDSGTLRRFDPIGEDLESNTAFKALMRLKAALVADMEVSYSSRSCGS
ncbi:2OG-Fe dioxygenase family protein [Streptomyces flavofungini]|uniref:2OG-Fe dioxygenase family protein n=1 Tax=Streptomyces flavofungini TaxID=68200 RepID=A0ABS0X8A9_9ACTN|nr:2OG-Fe dioxygenase family protein [Streptomyces flavofungini]MBJ3809209.1 2OG-Fe dioxygenase family protein [Streptomyces flavofungini]